jgi:Na+/H+ antiporter NhaD/arsenite permease-like protein
MTGSFVPRIPFGVDPMWVSVTVLAVTYAFSIAGRFNRAVVALIGAVAVIILGVLDQAEAVRGIDWDTIGLLTGLMILVAIARRSGLFQYVAVWSAQKVKANPAGILLVLQIATALLSAVLNNVSTVLLMVPVTLAIAAAISVFVRRGVCRQYRRHRDADRRPAQHFDRLRGRPRL